MKDPAEAVKLLLKAFYPYIMRVICNIFFFFYGLRIKRQTQF